LPAQRSVDRLAIGRYNAEMKLAMVGFEIKLFFSAVSAGLLLAVHPAIRADEPPAINPFGQVKQEREDAVPGYLEMSDGSVYPGSITMTRDKRLKIYDEKLERQREVPLGAIRQIECKVVKEGIEKEWRFKESALDDKVFTGRSYPARQYAYTITLSDGRTITGPVADIFYVRPYLASGDPADAAKLEAQRFILYKRDKGNVGTSLKSLKYVKRIKLGEAALEEGRKKGKIAN
jgi:hypothetical protein